MKKILIYVLLCTATLMACNDDLTELNENVKKPAEVAYQTLFSNAQLSLADAVTSANVNNNIFRLIVQHWTQTTYLDETRYNLATRNIPQNFWHTLYRDVLQDLHEARRLLMADATVSEEMKKNELAMIEIMEVYTWSVLVLTFGDIPYTQALDIENIRPAYVDDAVVFNDLIARVTAATNALNASVEGFESADLLYRGNVAKWIRFGNSLKLRLGMTLADVDPAKAAAIVAETAQSVFISNADNAVFEYSTIPPNTNPIWVDLVQSKRQDFVGAQRIVTVMDSLDDPRIDNYFTIDADPADGLYSGGRPGFGNSFFTYSRVDTLITQESFPGILMSYAEVEFYLAEAAARGFAVPGTAVGHYNEAVTASILQWGGTEEEAAAYLAQPAVGYTTAGGDFRQKIGIQKWIALYNRGFEAWTEWRRLDYPKLTPARRAVSAIPVRFTYPVSEQNLNTPNFEQAAAAIGGDLVTTKLFWDRF